MKDLFSEILGRPELDTSTPAALSRKGWRFPSVHPWTSERAYQLDKIQRGQKTGLVGLLNAKRAVQLGGHVGITKRVTVTPTDTGAVVDFSLEAPYAFTDESATFMIRGES